MNTHHGGMMGRKEAPLDFNDARLTAWRPIERPPSQRLNGEAKPAMSVLSNGSLQITAADCFSLKVTEMPDDSNAGIEFLASQCLKQLASIEAPGVYTPLLLNFMIAPSRMDQSQRDALQQAVRDLFHEAGYGDVPVFVSRLDEAAVQLGAFRRGTIALSVFSHVLSVAAKVPGETNDANRETLAPLAHDPGRYWLELVDEGARVSDHPIG